MLLTYNTSLLTTVGHYSLAHLEGKELLPDRVPPTIVPEGEQEVFRLTLSVDGVSTDVEAAGSVTLVDGSIVPVADLVLQSIEYVPLVDEGGQPILDGEGNQVTQMVTVDGSLLKTHRMAFGAKISVLRRESIGVFPVFSIPESIALSCGIAG